MNYLGHAFLSFDDPEILAGNMIGDYVKGHVGDDQYPEGIKKGIMLHRAIDEFADNHPASQRAKVWFRGTYGLYAGAIIDTLYDHFLATDPHYFKNEEALLQFSQEVYRKVEAYEEFFPEKFAMMFPYMKEQNWLYNYRTMSGMKQSLKGLHRRAKYMAEPDEAYNTFVTTYYQIGGCYYEFIEKAYSFVKGQLRQ